MGYRYLSIGLPKSSQDDHMSESGSDNANVKTSKVKIEIQRTIIVCQSNHVFYYPLYNEQNCNSIYDLRCGVSGSSVSKNDDNVRYVAAITCRWSQHGRANVGKCSSRVGAACCVTEWRDGSLKWWYCRVGIQIKAGSNTVRKGDKTHACVTAVNIQHGDQPRQKRLRQAEVCCTDTSRFVDN